MARSGIYKSDVLRARNQVLAEGRHPSIDAVRGALGTGSKSTIHRYLKEINEEEGPTSGSRVAVSEAIQDLVGRLAARLNEEAEERVEAVQSRLAEQLSQHQQATAALTTELQTTRQQLAHTQRVLADEQAAHGTARETLGRQTLERTKLTQQVADLQERIAAEEGHRRSLEEKHQHARQALEHFRQAIKEQRDQDQRQHDQQVQYLQAELRTVNGALTAQQQKAVHTLQENARLLGDLSRVQGDAHRAQEELRGLRPLKDELVFAQKRIEELGRRLVEQETATLQLGATNEQLKVTVDGVLTANQQLELSLATAMSSVTVQEQLVASLLDRLSAAISQPKWAATNPEEGVGGSTQRD